MINFRSEINQEILKAIPTIGLLLLAHPKRTYHGMVVGISSVVVDIAIVKIASFFFRDEFLYQNESMEDFDDATPGLMYCKTHLGPIVEELGCWFLRSTISKLFDWSFARINIPSLQLGIGNFKIEITPKKISAIATSIIFVILHNDRKWPGKLLMLPTTILYQIIGSSDFLIPIIGHIVHNTICEIGDRIDQAT